MFLRLNSERVVDTKNAPKIPSTKIANSTTRCDHFDHVQSISTYNFGNNFLNF